MKTFLQIARIPRKYVKKYYYFRLKFLISVTVLSYEENVYYFMNQIRDEYENVIPAGMRKAYFRDHGHEYKYTRDEIEEMMAIDYIKMQYDIPSEPRKSSLGKVYQIHKARELKAQELQKSKTVADFPRGPKGPPGQRCL